MYLFTLTPNRSIEYRVGLETLQIIAESESQAREIADQQIPSVRSDAGSSQTNIVGVTARTIVEWKNPYLHAHLTQCEQSSVPAGAVYYQSTYAPSHCSECGGED